jgi:hypothetical protein
MGAYFGALVTALFPNTAVTPANAGVQYAQLFGQSRRVTGYWFPAFAGMTA